MKFEKSKISEINLNNLIYAIQKKYNVKAYFILYSYMNKWMNFIVYKNEQKFKYIILNQNDWIYYKKISFFRSVMSFDFLRGIPFPQFAIQQLNWFLLGKSRKYISFKYRQINFATFFDEQKTKLHVNKYKDFSLKEKADFAYYLNFLTPFEKKIFQLKIQKYKNREIAEELQIHSKKVDNAWQRAKKKLKKYITDNKKMSLF